MGRASGVGRSGLLPVVKKEIAARFWKDNPQIGPRMTPWCEAIGDEFGVDVHTVARVIAQERELYLNQMRATQMSSIEDIAQLSGATLARALGVFASAMGATKKRYMKDSHGNLKTYPEGHSQAGEPVILEEPDWYIQLRAAEDTIRATTGWAAQKVEIEQHTVTENLSDVELRTQLAATYDRVSQFLGTQSGTRKTAAIGSRREGAPVDPRSVVLDAELHEDAGRTGPGEPA